MFTGIVEEKGTVKGVYRSGDTSSINIDAAMVTEDTKIGDSIAVNGVCLTVTNLSGNGFTADVMNETLSRSALSDLSTGSSVNLERAMPADGRFGGHIVSGHIDGTGIISGTEKDGNALWFTIDAPKDITKYIIEKGSVAVDGISLTVAEVSEGYFKVSVIPHTMENTCLLHKKRGDIVNIENDCIGKYVEKMLLNNHIDKEENKSPLTEEFLSANGF